METKWKYQISKKKEKKEKKEKERRRLRHTISLIILKLIMQLPQILSKVGLQLRMSLTISNTYTPLNELKKFTVCS
jgi:hypothetical protein